MLFDGSEPRLALYSSLISHFRNFQEKPKNEAEQGLKSYVFWSKNVPWASLGSVLVRLGEALGDS